MAVRILCEVAHAHHGLTPQRLWSEYTRSQVLMLWEEAQAAEKRRLASTATISHAATCAAILNTLSGQATPEFDRMVESLYDADEAAVGVTDESTLASVGLEGRPKSDLPLEQMEEF